MEELLHRGYTDVVDADLSDYFGSIPHDDLMKSVARRVMDRRVLRLQKKSSWNAPLRRPTGVGGNGARRKPRTLGAVFASAPRFHHCWRICTCAGSCWAGSNGGSSIAWGTDYFGVDEIFVDYGALKF